MSDAAEQQPADSPGAAKLAALATGGFNTDEVNSYRDKVSGQMVSAGFRQDEINNYWGVKTPDTSGVANLAQQSNDLSPANQDMRKEVIGSYERGETKNPMEFVTNAMKSVLPVVASAAMRATHPLDTLEEMGDAAIKGMKAAPAGIASAFSDQANQDLIAAGDIESPKPDVATPGSPTGPELINAATKGERTSLGAGASALFWPISALTAPVFNPIMEATPGLAQKAGVSPGYAATIPGVIGTLMDVFGMAGLAKAGDIKAPTSFQENGGPWTQVPKAQDFPDTALNVNGQHAEVEVSQVLRNIYAEKGIPPQQVLADAKVQPSIAQDLAAGKMPSIYETPAQEENQPSAAAAQEQEKLASPAPAASADTAKAAGSVYQNFTPDQLTLDPKRFQYKAANDSGVTGALQGVKQWEPALANPITVWQGDDGKSYVVNGHQRYDLASRAAEGGQSNVQMPARVFKESEGYTPEYMRTLGAYQNIAEGSGTSIDAAKIIRTPLPDQWRLPELPPKSQLVQQAHGLSALGDDSFGMVVNDIVPPAYAAEVGHAITDQKDQLAAMDVLAKNPPSNISQARLMVNDIKNSGFLQGEQESLFGDAQTSQSLFGERSRILENSIRQLRQLKTAFGVASDYEGALTEAGNVLSTESNIKAKESNEKLISALQVDATRKGPISDALSDAARQLKSGQSVAAVTKQFLDNTRELNTGRRGESVQSGTTTSGNEPAQRSKQSEIAGAKPANPDQLGDKAPSFQRQSVAENMATIRTSVQDADSLLENPTTISDGRQIDKSIAGDGDKVQYQAPDTKEELFKLADKHKAEYTSWIKDLTDQVEGAAPYSEGKGGPSGVRVKTREGRIDEKIAEKGGDAGAVSDYLGGAIEVKTPKALAEVLSKIKESGRKVVEVDDMLTSDDKEKNDGYRALHMQIELEPGFSAELQILPKDVARIKETLHPEYVKLRDVGDNGTQVAEEARQKMMREYQTAFNKFTGAVPDNAVSIAPGIAAIPKTEYTAHEVEIADAVNQEILRLTGGKAVAVNTGKLFATGDHPGEVIGAATRVREDGLIHRLVIWSMESDDPLGTARHEVIHDLRSSGMITPGEWSTLEKAAEKGNWLGKHKIEDNYDGLTKSQKIEEAIAEEFRTSRETKFADVPEAPRTIFQKVADFFDSVASRVREIIGNPEARATDIFDRIDSGEVGNRGAASDSLSEPKFQTAEQSILSHINIGGKEKGDSKLSWNDFYKHAVDRLDPIARITEALQRGDKSAVLRDTYKLMRNLAGNYGRAQHFLEQGTYDFNTYKNTGKSLKEILAPVKDDMNGLRAYAASRRAIELEDRGIKSGMPVADARKVISDGAGKFEPIFKDLTKYQDSILKYLKDSGVLTDEQLKSLKGANNSYVPFYRIMDDEMFGVNGGASAKVKNPLMRIKGSERDIVDPIESIVKNTYSYIAIAEKNAAVKSFYEGAMASKNPEDFFTKQPPRIAPTEVSEKEMNTFLKKEGIEGTPENTLKVFRAMRTPLARDEIGFFDNGKWTVLKVDPDLAEAFNGTPRAQHGMLFKMLALPAKMLRYGLVEPAFIIRHLERNTLSATVIGEKGKIPFENLYKGMFSYLNKDEWYDNWLKSGGKVSALSGVTRDDIQDQMHRLVQEAPQANFLNKVWNVARTPLDVIHAAQQSLENMQRLGAYKTALKGLSVDKANIVDAGYYARNVAPDPSRIGQSTGLWNSITALANTEIQHTAQLVDALKNRPLPTLAKGFAFITLPTIINWAINHNTKQYQEAQDWERDAFWIVPTGGYNLRIPKPFFMGFLFGTVPERMLDLLAGNDPHGHGVESMIKDMFEQATPNTIPTALTPILEQITNHSFFRGTPLVPEHLMQQLPEYRYSEYTSELTKGIAKLVGHVPYVGNTSMASPVVIDNYLRAWTGAMGTYVKDGLDAAMRKTGILPDPLLPTRTLADIPFVRAFVMRYPSAQAESIQRFQDDYRDMSMVTNTYKALIKQREVGEARDLMANNPTAFMKLDQINKTINQQNQIVRQIYKLPTINPDEKRQLIDSTYNQMIQLSRAGNNLLDSMKQRQAATQH